VHLIQRGSRQIEPMPAMLLTSRMVLTIVLLIVVLLIVVV